MKTKIVVGILLIAVLALSACVPQSKLDTANAQITKLTADLATANANLAAAQKENAALKEENTSLKDKLAASDSDLAAAKNNLTGVQNQLDQFNGLMCKQTWDFVMNKASGARPLSVYKGVPDYLVPYIFVTNWNTSGQVDTNKPFSVLLIDLDGKQSLVLDTVNDCIIANPSVFPFGR